MEKGPHEIGVKHVSRYANYIDDIIEPENTLYGAIGYSKKAHSIIKKLDLREVWKSDGIVAVVTVADIPGRNDVRLFMMVIQFFQKRLNIPVSPSIVQYSCSFINL